jgi:hypothetical protein
VLLQKSGECLSTTNFSRSRVAVAASRGSSMRSKYDGDDAGGREHPCKWAQRSGGHCNTNMVDYRSV